MAEDKPRSVAAHSVESVDRVLTILELMAADPTPKTYTELLHLTGLPRSSLHGLLGTLAKRSWLSKSSVDRSYSLGVKTLETGAAYLGISGISSVQHIIDDLSVAVGEAVNLGTLEGRDVLYLAVRRSPHPLAMRSAVGARIPAHASAMGKALLATLSDDAIRERMTDPLIRLARNTHTDIDALLADIAVIRTRGYAVELEEATDGIGCIAIAVETSAPTQLALSTSFPLMRHTSEMEQPMVAALDAAQKHLAAALTIDPEAMLA